MPRKFRKRPVLSATYQVPRYKYSEKDENYYDTPDEYGTKKSEWMPVYRLKTNTIEVPDRINPISQRNTHMIVQDTDGHEILKNGWYTRNVIDEIYRSLPHWGFKIVKNIASDPNVIVVEKETDDYMTVTTSPYPGEVESATDMFGMDDSFFTKEELQEFASAVEDDVNEKFKSFNSDFSIQYTGVWMEDDNRTITMDYICFPNETEYSSTVRVDMRKISSPDHIFKYVEPMALKIESEIKDAEVTGSSNICAADEDGWTFEKLAQIVADGFQETMTEEGFDTFEEMKDCYWWSSNDIKDEIDYMIRQATDDVAYIDELDRSEVFIGGSQSISYRQFSSMWKKLLKGGVTGSTAVKAGEDYVGNLLPFGDEDGYYMITAYADDRYRGRMDDFTSNSFDEIVLKANEYCNSGFYIEVENMGSGEGKRYTPDEWLECIEKTGEPPYSIYNLSDGNIEGASDIECATNIDALERIAHDVFNDVMSGRGRDQITDEIILDAAKKYDASLSGDNETKVIDLVNESIDSYFNRGPFGQVQAEKYGDKILQAYEGQTISKRRDKANDPGGLTYCANAIGLGTFQLLEALEGMCADGRAREIDDSTYRVGR